MQIEKTSSLPLEFGPRVREAVGIFDDPQNLQAALDDLEQNGFMRQELSVLAPEWRFGDPAEQGYAQVSHAADDPRAPRTIFVPEEIIGELEGSVVGLPLYISAIAGACIAASTGASLPVTVVAAALAGLAGGAVGTVAARYIARAHADSIQRHLESGGMLLWAAVRDDVQERHARRIMARHSAHGIHVHDIPLNAR